MCAPAGNGAGRSGSGGGGGWKGGVSVGASGIPGGRGGNGHVCVLGSGDIGICMGNGGFIDSCRDDTYTKTPVTMRRIGLEREGRVTCRSDRGRELRAS